MGAFGGSVDGLNEGDFMTYLETSVFIGIGVAIFYELNLVRRQLAAIRESLHYISHWTNLTSVAAWRRDHSGDDPPWPEKPTKD
jgi:hypothetical protein